MYEPGGRGGEGGGGGVNEKFSPLDEYFVDSLDSAFAGVPQFGQKRMFSGTDVPQFEQERVEICDILFPLSIESRDGEQRIYANLNDCNIGWKTVPWN